MENAVIVVGLIALVLLVIASLLALEVVLVYRRLGKLEGGSTPVDAIRRREFERTVRRLDSDLAGVTQVAARETEQMRTSLREEATVIAKNLADNLDAELNRRDEQLSKMFVAASNPAGLKLPPPTDAADLDRDLDQIESDEAS